MFRALVAFFLVVLALAGCGGGGDDDESSVSASKGESLVLEPDDVGKKFTRFDQGTQQPADFSPPRNDPERFGREGGWKARFKHVGTKVASGPLVINAYTDLFDSAEHAGRDFDLYKEYLDQFLPAHGRKLDPPHLGDESYAVTFQQGFAPNLTRYYYVAWREGNVTASVFINGFEGRTSFDDVLSLARKQQSRIESAAAA